MSHVRRSIASSEHHPEKQVLDEPLDVRQEATSLRIVRRKLIQREQDIGIVPDPSVLLCSIEQITTCFPMMEVPKIVSMSWK